MCKMPGERDLSISPQKNAAVPVCLFASAYPPTSPHKHCAGPIKPFVPFIWLSPNVMTARDLMQYATESVLQLFWAMQGLSPPVSCVVISRRSRSSSGGGGTVKSALRRKRLNAAKHRTTQTVKRCLAAGALPAREPTFRLDRSGPLAAVWLIPAASSSSENSLRLPSCMSTV